MDANSTTAANEAFLFIGTADFSSTDATGQLRYEVDIANNARYLYGSTDADSDAEFMLTLTGTSVLEAEDFIV